MEPAFRDLWQTLNISNDDIIRTTQPRHIAGVQKFLQVLLDRGYIYKDAYDGWYCRPDETYFTRVAGAPSRGGAPRRGGGTGRSRAPALPGLRPSLERIQEESWFFKLSAFEQPLLDFYEATPASSSPRRARTRSSRL